VRAAALGVPGPEAPPAEATGAFLARFYDDLMAVLEGLLRGNQQVRRAVRERLEPQRLVETANREAKLGLLVQAAANSALWKLYVQAFQEVTGDAQYEQELAQLLQKALQGRVEA
jgi:predicted component of type VI protein secretion system